MASEISIQQFLSFMEEERPFELIDVREEEERNEKHIGGKFLPLSQFENLLDQIATDKPVIIYCRSGRRSLVAAEVAEERLDVRAYSLQGGIEAFFAQKQERATISYEEFARVDLRSGTIIQAEAFPKARKPAYKVWADFGPGIGVLQTSAQITEHYTPESLVGRPIIGCLNLGEKNIAGFISQFLLVGFSDERGAICLATTESTVPNGKRLH